MRTNKKKETGRAAGRIKKKLKTNKSLPLRPRPLLGLGRRGLGAGPSGEEEPREQEDVRSDERRERQAQAAPAEVERLAHDFSSSLSRRKVGVEKKKLDDEELMPRAFSFVFFLLLDSLSPLFRAGESEADDILPCKAHAREKMG